MDTHTKVHNTTQGWFGKLFEDFSAFPKKKQKKLSNFSMYIIAHGKVWFLYKDSFLFPFFACLLALLLFMYVVILLLFEDELGGLEEL